ncbi:2-keto-4-pentenoate hydratase [Pelagibius sp.]|uniref:2-keto-4-pentenoate hydratase n=1 Tax=Pelagibius sp. TaxID=1931238 RepID=UPI00263570E3|nr:hydratase [Pelagibius sp.]
MPTALSEIADRLIAAYDDAVTLAPITAARPAFSVDEGYAVLEEIEARRRAAGWRPLGRKIGFTNRTLWDRYGVWQPMWAHVWDRTVHGAEQGRASLALRPFVQPRLEPEVVFKLKAPVPVSDDPVAVLESVEWIAAGFEIVQSHFPDWRFTAADCTAAFGLHGALVVGTPLSVTDANRTALAETLPVFTASLSRGDNLVERGRGANVLDSPALALVHLARVLSGQPQFPPLAAGEIVTTGTLTDAWPVEPGETWSSDYGELGLEGLTVTFT